MNTTKEEPKKNGNKNQETPKDPPKATAKPPSSDQAPAGYAEQSDEIVGFWDEKSGSPIHCIPLGMKLFDGNIDKSKPGIIVLAKLVDPCPLVLKEEEFQGKAGDVVGIWGKPGMKALKGLANVKVWMRPDGEKDIGRGNPMKLYKILAKEKGQPLPIFDDTREESAETPTVFDARRKGDASDTDGRF